MLLRASGEESGESFDLASLAASRVAETGVPHGALLIELAEAALGADASSLDASRRRVLAELGPEALVDACAVVANFQQMVRIADATGIPLGGMLELASATLRAEIGLDRFASAANTPRSLLRTIAGRLLAPLRPYLFRMARSSPRRP